MHIATDELLGHSVLSICFETNRCTIISHCLVAGIHDALHAHEPHAAHAHVHEVPVLSGPHVPHPSSEVGCSYISQWPSITLQELKLDML